MRTWLLLVVSAGVLSSAVLAVAAPGDVVKQFPTPGSAPTGLAFGRTCHAMV